MFERDQDTDSCFRWHITSQNVKEDKLKIPTIIAELFPMVKK
jgi:hypothetical protein